MSQILESFTSLELPDAIDAILLGADDMEPGSTDAALSRYASRLFGELGASRMRDIATSHHVATGRLSNTDLFWLRFNPSELSEEEFGYLLATEGIMNRLRLVEEVFESHAGTQGADEARGSFAEGECAMADIGVIEGVSYAVPRMLHSSPNHLKSIHGASCKRGGEWDVRSRFALAVESLRLPFRLMYHFDCDAANGLFRVNFNAPAGAWMPRCRFEADIETWVDASDQQEALASEYTLRLAAVLAAAAFGSGVGIKRVHLLADPLWDSEGTSLSLVVDRIPFIAKLLPDIVDGDPSWLERFREMFEGTDEELDEQLRCRHLPLSRDTRELPEDLKKLLHADLACELDVRSQDDDERWDAVREAYEDSETSPVAAIATLEALVADAGAIEADEQGRFPLFCTDEVARVAVHQTVVAVAIR